MAFGCESGIPRLKIGEPFKMVCFLLLLPIKPTPFFAFPYKTHPQAGHSTPAPPAGSSRHFPGVSAAAARWLVEHRDLRGLGVDTLSPDAGASEGPLKGTGRAPELALSSSDVQG